MTRKNVLFLLIDGMRYDVLADPPAAAALLPNLARLAGEGFVLRGVANAQSTQFVMPALFSQTYPLDHGGYNDGIAGRPASFVERLRAAGYHTCLTASCNLLTPQSGYDRGFEYMGTAADYRHLIEYRIEKTLSHHLNQWRAGEIGEAEAIAHIAPDMERLLAGIEDDVRRHSKELWSGRLRRINEAVARKVPAELELLRREPAAVMRKLAALPPILYWRWMGRRRINPVRRFLHRALESVRWRSRALAGRFDLPFVLLTHYQVIAGEVFGGLRRLLPTLPQPWYAHLHVMDLHDSFAQSRPLHALGKFRYLPRYLRARRAGATRRHVLYDLALCYVDAHIGKLLRTLEESGKLENLLIVVTADHGNYYAGSPRHKRNIAFRSNVEDIEVPVAVWGAGPAPAEPGLVDSMGTTATILDLCGVSPDPSFKGISIYQGGREAVISESAGAGYADLVNKDLYFTVTTRRHRLMTVLRGSEIEVLQLFDRREDPWELDDLSRDAAQAPVVAALLAHLHAERGELLALRGALPPEGGRRAAAAG